MKTITDNQVHGELGEVLARAAFLKIGFLYEPRGRLESGVDGLVELRNPTTGQALGRILAVQVKTTEKGRYTAETNDGFEYLLEPNDLDYWRQSNIPVVIVLCRLSDETMYWKPVEHGLLNEPRRLRISKSEDVLDATAADRLGGLTVNRATPGLWLPPLGTGERAMTNMLRIVSPGVLYAAPTWCSHGGEAVSVVAKRVDRRFDWVVRGHRLLSFFDPREQCTAELIGPDQVSRIEIQSIATGDSEDDRNDVAHLLRRSVEHRSADLLRYQHKEKLFYFRSEEALAERIYAYQSLSNRATATVVRLLADRADSTKVFAVRHHAFSARFEAIGDEWFIVIEPTYFFTDDGFSPHRLSATLLAGKKRLENAGSVRGQIIMWQGLMCGLDGGAEDLFDQDALNDYPLRFERVPIDDYPVSVPESDWSSSRGDASAAETDDLFA